MKIMLIYMNKNKNNKYKVNQHFKFLCYNKFKNNNKIKWQKYYNNIIIKTLCK